MELNLLEKTELWIEKISLNNADLNQVALTVADVLELPRDKVLVVDVRDNHITLDILQQQVKAESIYGKKRELLERLRQLSGIEIFADTDIHSEGILGMIGLDEEEATHVLENTRQLTQQIQEKIAKRVIVFPTGFEVKRGMIKDTNTPLIKKAMEEKGYKVSVGEILDDDMTLIAGKIRQAIYNGYGLVITTGGVGAEDKDRTIEGILTLDPQAAVPYVVKFKKGTGRHEKEGVRIGVGRVGQTLIVALPGPNDEVKLGINVLVNTLEQDLGKEQIAQRLVEALRDKLKAKMHHCHHLN
ncbi:MAG: hypothetical protein PWQ67_941 [Clostridia bacterium]|nr:hypothetical protein [Clostridia bacterium]MDN5322487.1 hypothetical protein [Clostridia bacterium]